MPRGGKRPGAGRKKGSNDKGSAASDSFKDSKLQTPVAGTDARTDPSLAGRESKEIKEPEIKEPEIKESKVDSNQQSNHHVPEGQQVSNGGIQTELGKEASSIRGNPSPSEPKLGGISNIVESMAKNMARQSGASKGIHNTIGNGLPQRSSEIRNEQAKAKSSTGSTDQRTEQYGSSNGTVELTPARIEILRDAISDPVRWCEWLFDSPLEEWQRDAAREFAEGKRVSRAVCNNGGKTRLFAGLGSWNLARFKSAKSIMTAGVYLQCLGVRDELRRVAHKLTGWTLKEQELVHPSFSRFIWFSADNPGFFEGHHADYVAVLIDEAKSVDGGIYTASERLTANKKRFTIVASSPGGAVGWFYDTFTSKREFWSSKHVSSYEIKRIQRSWIDEQERMHGRDSALFKSMVLAQFTESEEGSLIKLEWVNRCIQTPPYFKGGDKVAGLDPAGGGDDNSICIREGNRINEFIRWKDKDTMRAAGRFIAELRQRGINKANCYADSGGVGQGILDKMAELDFPVHRVHFGGAPLYRTEAIMNRMTELWINMKAEIEGCKIILPKDDMLIAQLTSRLAVVQSSGKVKLETKEEMRRRGVPSPNDADSLALALLPATVSRKSITIDDEPTRLTYGDGNNQVGVSADNTYEFGN